MLQMVPMAAMSKQILPCHLDNSLNRLLFSVALQATLGSLHGLIVCTISKKRNPTHDEETNKHHDNLDSGLKTATLRQVFRFLFRHLRIKRPGRIFLEPLGYPAGRKTISKTFKLSERRRGYIKVSYLHHFNCASAACSPAKPPTRWSLMKICGIWRTDGPHFS